MKRNYVAPAFSVMQCDIAQHLSSDIDVSGDVIIKDTSEGMDGW